MSAACPPAPTVLARTPVCAQAFRVGAAAWGIQFHAEVTPPTLERWIVDYRSDPDAVRIGVDPEALRAATRRAARRRRTSSAASSAGASSPRRG